MQRGYSWIQGDATSLAKQYGHEESHILPRESPLIDVDHVTTNFMKETRRNTPLILAMSFEFLWTAFLTFFTIQNFRTACAGYVSSFWSTIFFLECQDELEMWLCLYIFGSLFNLWQCIVLLSKGFKPGLNAFATPQPDLLLPVSLYYLTCAFMLVWNFVGIIMVTHTPEPSSLHTVAMCTVVFFWIFFIGVRCIANDH